MNITQLNAKSLLLVIVSAGLGIDSASLSISGDDSSSFLYAIRKYTTINTRLITAISPVFVINVENENSLIEENDNNSYKVQSVTNEYIANEYFVLYKRLALSDPELLYNMFSNEYKSARFGSLNEFKNYINNNKEEIMKINMGQYLVDAYDEYTEFVAKDQFGNYYVFDENNSKGDVEIKLDTYTIPTEKFKTEYDKAESEKKVQMNIDKFIQMVNRHDYKTSYN